MSQFVTALELATYLNGTTDVGDLTPEFVAQADLLCEMVSADVEAAAGFPIGADTATVFIPGTWHRDLELPAGPVVAVSGVALNGQSLAASEFTFNERSLLRRGSIIAADAFDGDDFFDDWCSLGRQGASWRSGRHWGGPSSTVTAVLTLNETVPDIVRSLTLRVLARTIGNVANVTQESLAIYSVTYGQSSADDGSHVTKAERNRLRSALGGRRAGTISAGGR